MDGSMDASPTFSRNAPDWTPDTPEMRADSHLDEYWLRSYMPACPPSLHAMASHGHSWADGHGMGHGNCGMAMRVCSGILAAAWVSVKRTATERRRVVIQPNCGAPYPYALARGGEPTMQHQERFPSRSPVAVITALAAPHGRNPKGFRPMYTSGGDCAYRYFTTRTYMGGEGG